MSQVRIADLLLREISGFSDRLQLEHPLMEAARRGRVSPSTVASYLAGIRYLLEHTPVHLDAATKAALTLDAPELATFLQHKRCEEEGHARWAESDLEELQRNFGVVAAPVPASMIRMVAFIGSIVRSNPFHYLGYILFAEHATVQAGMTWVKALEDHCGIPLSALSSIAKHVELDQFHVAEGRDEVNHLLRDVLDPAPFLRTLQGAMSHFEAFCDELWCSVDRSSFRPSRIEARLSQPPS